MKKKLRNNIADEWIVREAQVSCPCGQQGRPPSEVDADYIREADCLPSVDVPEGPSGLCWTCRLLARYSSGPYGDFARRVARVLLYSNTPELGYWND
jgi:hypothetical protein